MPTTDLAELRKKKMKKKKKGKKTKAKVKKPEVGNSALLRFGKAFAEHFNK